MGKEGQIKIGVTRKEVKENIENIVYVLPFELQFETEWYPKSVASIYIFYLCFLNYVSLLGPIQMFMILVWITLWNPL